MISQARFFGAPLIEPPGMHERTASSASMPGRSIPSTVDTRWENLREPLELDQLRDRDAAILADAP